MNKPIKESLAGGVTTPSESAPITQHRSNPIVSEITTLFKKDKTFKGVDLVRVLEDGDVYHMDLRFEIESPSPQTQFTREEGKHKAYDIKRKLESEIIKKFNVPSFSIAGVRIVKGLETYCEFSISFIYANKGNLKPTNEDVEKDLRIRSLVESALSIKEQAKENDPLKEALEGEYSEAMLEKELAEWKKLSLAIQQHEEAFKQMIAIQLATKQEVESRVYAMMEKLEVKTKKVDGIVAKIIAGGFKSQGPTPTEKVAILMSKINEATKKVVMAEFEAKTIQAPFSAHQSISFEKPKTEGLGDTIKSGYNKFKSILSTWASSVKEMFSAVDELERLVPVEVKEDDQFPISESAEQKRESALNFLERMGEIHRPEKD